MRKKYVYKGGANDNNNVSAKTNRASYDVKKALARLKRQSEQEALRIHPGTVYDFGADPLVKTFLKLSQTTLGD